MSMDLHFGVEVDGVYTTDHERGEECRPGRFFRHAVFVALPSQRGEHNGSECLGSDYSFSKYEGQQVVMAFYVELKNIPFPDALCDIIALQSSIEAITMLASWAYDEDDDRRCYFC